MEAANSSTEVPKYPRLSLGEWPYPVAVLLLAAAYLAAAALGLRFAFAGANVSPLWPPTGLAIAALVLYGPRLWPGVLVGAFLANLLISPLPPWVAAGIASGNCAEAVIAAQLLRQVGGFQPAFTRFKDTITWMLCAGAGAIVSASAGTLTLGLGHVVPWSSLGHAWWTWFSGDTLGALVVGPALLVWARPAASPWTRAAWKRAAGILAAAAAVSALVFLTPVAARTDLSPLAFATLPVLIWAGHRVGPRGATLANLLVCSAAIWGTAGGLGAYAGFRELNEKVSLLQGFIAVAAACSLGFATLVKERDRAKEKRQVSEEGFRRLVQSVRDYAIFMLDPEGHVATWNKGAERLKGYRAEEVMGRSFDLFYPPEEVAAGRPAVDLEKAALLGGIETEGWRIRKDGSRFYANLTLYPIRSGDGELKGFAEVTRDITELMVMMNRLRSHREELEEQVQLRTRQLAQSQQTLYLVYDGVQDPMAMVAPAEGGGFTVVSCNRAWADLKGSNPKALVGKPLAEAVDPRARGEVLAALGQAARSGQPSNLELRIGGPMEQVFDAQITPILDEGGGCAHLLVAARDISQRLRMEEAARQAQKLESLGVMAGGIAHDFNNLLTGVLGNASLGLLSAEPGGRARACFERIEHAAVRAADLTRQLLAYAGKGRYMVEEVDLNAVVEEMTRLFPSSMPRKVALRTELSAALPGVKADPVQMQQVIMNLLTNAAESISEGREERITVRTSARTLDRAFLQEAKPDPDLPSGPYVLLEVDDTGVGMAPELQAKIFDPFFSTKFTGRGLGLPALLGILRTHGGGVRVRSEPGVGSAFTLFLPAAAEVAKAAPPPPAEIPWRWEGTLLVVDDDDMIRSLARRIAEHLGLTVLEARDGLEGVTLFQERHKELNLVLMDLTMPRVDGREAFLRMKAIDPTVPIVLSSGYNEEDATEAFHENGLAGFLQKPYRRETFVLALREGLAKSPLLREGSGPVKAV